MEGVKRWVAKTWAQRAQAELGAKRKFQDLVERLADNKVDYKIISLAFRAMQDEHRHAEMCSDVAKSYGHKTGFELMPLSRGGSSYSWSSGESNEVALICDMVLMGCITETINASLLNSIYGASEGNSFTRRVVHEILKDEVKHGQMGWALLASEIQRRDLSFLSYHLEEMLDRAVRDELFAPVVIEFNDSINYGVLPEKFRLQQFRNTLIEVVLPGFQKFGIDTEGATRWMNQKEKKFMSLSV